MRRRRLFLLLDGTWNDPETGENDTNIVRLRNLLADALSAPSHLIPRAIQDVVKEHSPVEMLSSRLYKDIDYFFFYERGVGTGPGLDRFTGGALGWGLAQNIRRAYKFLSRTYTPGAEIFLFGFSRGAYTARSLVGYLSSSGLLRAEFCNGELEQRAWTNYRTAPNDRMPSEEIYLKQYTHSKEELRLACLGVFDTVGALGIPATALTRLNREFYQFHDVELSPIVRLNLHALAIDEHRRPFAASVWRQSRFRWSNSVTEQTWFPGVHADIGGGYLSSRDRIGKPRGLDEVTLDWMIKRLRFHYPDMPSLDSVFAEVKRADSGAVHHESRTGKYRMYKPALRSVGNRHFSARGRTLVSYDRHESVVGESIHISALERLGCTACYHGGVAPYLPYNIIVALRDLYERYCVEQTRSWDSGATSATLWSGDIVQDDGNAGHLETIRTAIMDALRRLRDFGVDPLATCSN